ncbi:MAG: mandelate racemase/muconate lactonizing enzyme family protein [Dehalococcoidia bacterium]
MKVTEIKSYSVQDESGRAYFIVRVDTDAGIHGLGEVGIRNWGRAITEAIDHLSELVKGADPWETERLWQEMFRVGFFPADKVYCCAISAIDIALWDIKGKSVDKPVYKLLGGPVRDKVISYPHTQGGTMEQLVENSKKAVDDGWKFVRWGQPETSGEFEARGKARLEPVKSMRLAVEQMSRVREAVGPEIQICFDVHTRLDTAHVVQMCKDLEEFKPFFIEDPVRSENPGTYRNLRRQINLPIAAGEQWASKWPFREVIEEDLIDYARIDLCIVGGLTEALKVTHWAETHYIDIVPHNPLGPVSAAACVALCMASTNVGVQEMPRKPGSYGTDLFPVQIGWEDGFSFCHDAPGLGIEFNVEAAERNRVDPRGWPPRLYREDGALTNW